MLSLLAPFERPPSHPLVKETVAKQKSKRDHKQIRVGENKSNSGGPAHWPHTNHLGPGIYRGPRLLLLFVATLDGDGLALAPFAPGWPQALVPGQDMGERVGLDL